jgi:hypothetical protein
LLRALGLADGRAYRNSDGSIVKLPYRASRMIVRAAKERHNL